MNHEKKFHQIHEKILRESLPNEEQEEIYYTYEPKNRFTFKGFLKFTGITIASTYLSKNKEIIMYFNSIKIHAIHKTQKS